MIETPLKNRGCQACLRYSFSSGGKNIIEPLLRDLLDFSPASLANDHREKYNNNNCQTERENIILFSSFEGEQNYYFY